MIALYLDRISFILKLPVIQLLDVYSSVYAKELFQANKNITVTVAASGDAYEVELSEVSYI